MIYTTDSFRDDCKILAERVSSFPFTHILSIERGGGYVTRELIKYYHNAIIVPIQVSFYDGKKKRDIPVVTYESCKVFTNHDRVLVVDDLVDSGDSLKYVLNMYILNKCKVKTAVLLKKPTSIVDPDFCVHKNITSWVQFPHEDADGNHLASVSHTTFLENKGR